MQARKRIELNMKVKDCSILTPTLYKEAFQRYVWFSFIRIIRQARSYENFKWGGLNVC